MEVKKHYYIFQHGLCYTIVILASSYSTSARWVQRFQEFLQVV